MPIDPCPSEARLRAFLRGEVDDAEVDAIARHLEQCSACEVLMQALEAHADTLLQGLREASPTRLTDEQALVDTVIPDKFAGVILPSRPTAPGPSPDSVNPTDVDSEFLARGTTARYFGDYEIRNVLGRGAMGVVYKAHQVSLNRPVALKMIKTGLFADEGELRRFQNEVEAVAMLDHPGIVPVYEVGSHEGQRYFTMRLIAGGNLAERLASFHDRFRDAASLLAEVAEAVHHAHMRGILHRDLKPANILVDREGHPHVSDFGLAKRVEADPEMTATGMVLGTPAYMSPEQAAGSRSAVTTATDVYGLGAVFYALLVGKAPFGGTSVLGTLDAVRTRPPESPRRLNPKVPRDLQRICLKCLEKDPRLRYASAHEVATDLKNWLNYRPIHARRVGTEERLWLWCKRRPAVAALTAGVMLAVVGGTSAVIAVQAKANADLTKANGETTAALALTTEAQRKTVEALEGSEESRKQAEAVSTLLVKAFEKADPYTDTAGKDVKVADILDQALASLDKGFDGSKATEGAFLDALGNSYLGLGLYQKAEKALRKARAIREATLGPSSRETLRSATQMARCLAELDRRDEAVALHKATLGRQEAAFGSDDPDTLDTRSALANLMIRNGHADDAIPLHQKILAASESRLGPDHPATLGMRNDLALAYDAAGRFADALPLYQSTLKRYEAKLGPDHPRTLYVRNNLAGAYWATGRADKAIPIFEATMRQLESKLGPDHPSTLNSRNDLALAYQDVGRVTDAIPIFEAILKLYEFKLGPDQPGTISVRNNLGLAYQAAGRATEAIPIFEATLRRRESKLGPDHPQTLISRWSLAVTYQSAGRVHEAIPILESTLRQFESKVGPDHPNTHKIRRDLGLAYQRLDRFADADVLFRDNLARYRKSEKPDSRALANDAETLGRNLLKQSRWSEAGPLLRECLAIRAQAIPNHFGRFHTMSLLGGVLLGEGKYGEAEPLVVGGYEGMKVRESKIDANRKIYLVEAGDRVIHLYESWGKPDQAAEWRTRLGRLELPKDVFAK